MASVVTTVTSDRFVSMATLVSYWTSLTPVTPIRSGPGLSRAPLTSLTPEELGCKGHIILLSSGGACSSHCATERVAAAQTGGRGVLRDPPYVLASVRARSRTQKCPSMIEN